MSRGPSRTHVHRARAALLDVAGGVAIRRPMTDVAAFMFDPACETLWMSGVVESRALTPGPLRAGAQIERVASFLGRRIRCVAEVMDRQGSKLVETSLSSPIALVLRYELAEVPHGTWARICARAAGLPPLGPARPLLASLIRRRIEVDLERLRTHLEARG